MKSQRFLSSTEAVNFFQALSNSARQKIILILEKRPHCVSELVQKGFLAQPTISKHLKILKNSGIVSSKRKRQKIFYFLEKNYLKKELKKFLSNLESRS